MCTQTHDNIANIKLSSILTYPYKHIVAHTHDLYFFKIYINHILSLNDTSHPVLLCVRKENQQKH